MTLLCLESFDGIATADLSSKGWTISGSPTVSTTQARTGANALQINSNNESIIRNLGSGEHDTVIVGMAIYLINFGSGATSLLTLMSDGGATEHVAIGISVAGELTVRRGDYLGTVLGTGSVLLLNTWYYIELKAKLSDSIGTVDLRVNGVSVVSLTGQDTKNAGTKTVFDTVRIGVESVLTAYYDDVYIANGAGSINNDLLGDLRVRCLVPNANGNSSQLLGSDGNSVDNYLLVDEVPPSAVDYVGSGTLDQKDTYGFSNLPDTSGTVFGVQISALATKTDSGARSLALVTRSGGTDYDGPDVALSLGSNIYVQQMREADPAISAAWTREAINSAEFGGKVR